MAKRKRLTAKRITSRCGKKKRERKGNRERRKTQSKKKNLRQKENLTAKRKRLAAKFLRYREDILILISFAMRSRLFFLTWGYSFCREVILFAVRLILLPWQLWATVHIPLKFCSRRDSWFFNTWVFVRTSTNFAHMTSFQAIQFMDWPVPKTLDNSVCQTSQNAAFRNCCSSVVRGEEREHDLISSPVSTFSARSA